MILDEVKRIAVFQAIARVREQIIWKPGKATRHLSKRISRGHLPDDTTLEQYNTIITFVANNSNTNVYIYVYGETIYPTLVANVENIIWLVMIGLDGVLETAFPPRNPEGHLAKSEFVYLGSVKELEI
ncbi:MULTISPECIES: hypothetical protein [Kamptonema]|uniref:hypothetical protein n=1 Tax=Kamptonema TaxID=1501433 RepID=UPI0001DAD0AF|nr:MULTISPECIES: hypothetical protein [Kamptonema]CBN57654.1 hypothetical protein OSCI_3490034 [Kamptonema sp. PCC 6506]